MTNDKNKNFKSAIDSLLKWSKENHHQLPWRKKRSLYGTLVSEIMLQQTTVGTVLNHYEKFLKRFPTIEALANASHEELAVEWKGLGYYRRAKNLKSCAEEITLNFSGNIPSDRDQLLRIKGIGEYTADAIIAIGNNKKALAIDANIERVLARVFCISTEKGLKLQRKIRENFNNGTILNLSRFNQWRELNEALMDIGRIYCKSKKVFCENCPLLGVCSARIQKNMLLYPKLGNGGEKKEVHELKLLRLVLYRKNKLGVYKKKSNEWLSDQWEIPTLIISCSDKKLGQYPFIRDIKRLNVNTLDRFKTTITKYKIENYILEIQDHNELISYGFKERIEFYEVSKTANFSTATFKLIQFLKNKK